MEFFERLITIAVLVSVTPYCPLSFDGRGNYSMGVREQIIFSQKRLR